ncbi:MAG: baseplate tail-tube junction protein [Euryarchaeota archaeon]|jgi:hypothetical protein|nr:baseplate tail-tube junction protein [Euryarchaeota archaeon]
MEINGLSGGAMGPEAVLSPSTKRPQGAVPFKFPLEPISAGNFWTKITVSSWAPKGVTAGVKGQNHSLAGYHLADIWLPMPLTLGTGYNQNFSEAGDMMVNRAIGSGDGVVGALEAALGTAKATGAQAGKEVVNVVENLGVSMNASAKMSHASVINQNQGLVYDGATLRSHTLSWRMTPKNEDEQTAITEIVNVLKAYASPAVAGFWGGKDTTEEAAAKAKAKKDSLQKASGDNKEIFRKMGRLSIPPTVAVEFWYKDDINPFLFKIKDSFILSVEVNYTPTGTWNAYEDGAPVETQLTLNIKENSIVTHEEIEGGY